MLHIGLNKPSYALSNSDIDGSKPELNKFKTNRAPQNPLVPEYKLQSYQVVAPPPPKFIRDNIDVRDIEGAKPLVKKQSAQRDFYSVHDIDGAKPKLLFRRR